MRSRSAASRTTRSPSSCACWDYACSRRGTASRRARSRRRSSRGRSPRTSSRATRPAGGDHVGEVLLDEGAARLELRDPLAELAEQGVHLRPEQLTHPLARADVPHVSLDGVRDRLLERHARVPLEAGAEELRDGADAVHRAREQRPARQTRGDLVHEIRVGRLGGRVLPDVRDVAAGPQHALDLVPGERLLEPVSGLGRDDEVDRSVGQRQLLGTAELETRAVSERALGAREHLGVGLDADHVGPALDQRTAREPRAAAEIDHVGPLDQSATTGEVVPDESGVAEAIRLVGVGDLGEARRARGHVAVRHTPNLQARGAFCCSSARYCGSRRFSARCVTRAP